MRAHTVRGFALALAFPVLSGGVPTLVAQEAQGVDPAAVDAVFRAFDSPTSPGCVVGVSRDGAPILLRAYGMADLEHDVANTPSTVMEPGSVAKQFAAAAVVLLALDGKLSLDDDVRRYFPELPEYPTPVTIRHLLNHTSGLRDWGSVAGIEGWPRTRRAHTHVHVLDILSRQRELNYPAGAYYSYTNSGYNLQAILVERVSGMSFADFSRTRIFEPLGMTRTQWRDDFNRIVKDRAVAYRPVGPDAWAMLMPFEDVHGNGGLLTTVEDLLKFTQNLETGALGGPRFLEEMHRRGVLTSGQVIAYASGLQVGTYKGVRQVQHSGSTAGYRGHLARFPDQKVAVAVMCNTASGNATALLYQVADLYLAGHVRDDAPSLPAGALTWTSAQVEPYVGIYRDTRTGQVVAVVGAEIPGAGAGLRTGSARLVPVSPTRFEGSEGQVTLAFDAAPPAARRTGAVLDEPGHPGVRLEPVDPVDPTPSELAEYAGTYRSDEAEATYTVAVVDGRLTLTDRWAEARAAQPIYRDAFRWGPATLVFHRAADGSVEGFRLSESRVWGIWFGRR